MNIIILYTRGSKTALEKVKVQKGCLDSQIENQRIFETLQESVNQDSSWAMINCKMTFLEDEEIHGVKTPPMIVLRNW